MNNFPSPMEDPNLQEWVIVEDQKLIDLDHNSAAIKEKVQKIRNYLLGTSFGTCAWLYKKKVGRFLLEHSVAFYAYTKCSPQNIWEQYFYANATHETAVKILNVKLLGYSAASLSSGIFAVIASVIFLKTIVYGYNLYAAREFKEYAINLNVGDFVSGWLIPFK